MKFHSMGLPKGKDIWNILHLSDVHSLICDKQALLLVLKAFAKTPLETRKIILNGDILDFKFLYQKDECFKDAIRKGNWDYFLDKLDEEIIWWEDFYALIRTYVQDPEDIYFIEGNHEERARRKQFFPKIPNDLKHNFELKNILKAEDRQMKLVMYKDWLKIAPLRYPPIFFTHGHYVGLNVLKKHFEELNAGAVMVGHLHEKGSRSFKRAGVTVECYLNPCLCELDAEYMENRATNWSQGASQITVSRWDWSVTQYKIVNKRLYLPNGEVL